MIKYNLSMVRKIFEDKGLILDSDIYTNYNHKMECHDKNGFRYEVSLNSLLSGKHPYKYSKHNKFSLENIQLVLDKETDGVQLLSTEYKNNHTLMSYRCSCGKEFQMNGVSFVADKKRYCNSCAKSKRYDSISNYTNIILAKCKEIDCTLITTDEIVRQEQEFEYVCNKHIDSGVQKSTYKDFMKKKTGCKLCGIISRGEKHRIPIEEIKQLLVEKEFTYVNHEYIRYKNGSSKIQIECVCNKHRERGSHFLTYENLKHNKSGCIYCIGRGRTKEVLQNECDTMCNNIEILEFNDYTNIKVKCKKCNYEWKTKGVYITQGHSCPKCNMSNYEKRIESLLCNLGIKYFPQYKIDDCRDKLPLPFDFYLPKYNTLIEVDGQGHYMPIRFNGTSEKEALISYNIIKQHDKLKTQYCHDNRINLIRIPYYILDDKKIDIEQYLIDKIKNIH